MESKFIVDLLRRPASEERCYTGIYVQMLFLQLNFSTYLLEQWQRCSSAAGFVLLDDQD